MDRCRSSLAPIDRKPNRKTETETYRIMTLSAKSAALPDFLECAIAIQYTLVIIAERWRLRPGPGQPACLQCSVVSVVTHCEVLTSGAAAQCRPMYKTGQDVGTWLCCTLFGRLRSPENHLLASIRPRSPSYKHLLLRKAME